MSVLRECQQLVLRKGSSRMIVAQATVAETASAGGTSTPASVERSAIPDQQEPHE